MKRTVLLLLLFVLLAAAFLGTAALQPAAAEAGRDRPTRCMVNIQVGDSGYYLLLSDVDVIRRGSKIAEISIADPTLLAFRASERWSGGDLVYSYDRIQELIDVLKSGSRGEEQHIIDALEHGFLITQAGT